MEGRNALSSPSKDRNKLQYKNSIHISISFLFLSKRYCFMENSAHSICITTRMVDVGRLKSTGYEPAISARLNRMGLPYDQRGFRYSRIYGIRAAIGAVEWRVGTDDAIFH